MAHIVSDHRVPVPELRRDLSSMVVMTVVIGAVAPLMVGSGVNPTAIGATGITSLPIVYVAVGVLLLLFIPGYLAVSRYLPNPGAFYAITSRVWRALALGVAFVALVAYCALFVGLFGAWGATVAPQAAALTGLPAKPWQAMLAAWLVVTALSLMRVTITGKIVALLLAAEICFVALADAAMFAHPFAGHPQWQSWTLSAPTGPHHGVSALAAAIAAFCICFLGTVGIEGGATTYLETRNGHRTIRRGTIGAAIVIVLLYLATAWATAWAAGDQHLVARAANEQQSLLFNLVRPYLGTAITDAGTVLLDTSIFIGMLSFSLFWSRYAFSMASEGMLPGPVARTRPKAGVPAGAVITLMTVALVAIVIWSLIGWDPLVTLFFYGGTFGGFGIMLLFAISSIAVIGFYLRHPRHRRRDSLWVRLILPGLAAAGLSAAVVSAVAHYDVMLGVAPDNPLRWILPSVYGAILAGALIAGLILRVARRDRYHRIGLGVQAATGVAERPDLADDEDALLDHGQGSRR